MKAVRSVATGAIFQQALSLILVVVCTRWLGADGYGQIVTLVALSTTLFNLSTQWAQPYALRESSVRFASTGLISGEFFVPLILSLALLALMTLLGPWLGAEALPAFRDHRLLDIVMAALGYAAIQSARLACQIRQRFDWYGRLLSADKALILLVYAVIFMVGGMTADLAVRVYASCGLLAGLVGAWWSMRRTIELGWGGFDAWAFVRSGGAIAASIWMNNIASINFLTVNASGQNAAWLGAGGVVLGLVLQPFSWVLPTIAPQLSVDALAHDGPERIRSYVSGKVCLMVLAAGLASALSAVLILKTDLFALAFGEGFRRGGGMAALLVTMAPVEVANLLVIRAFYALSKESHLVLAMVVKMLPFGVALWMGARSDVQVLALVLGSWCYVIVLVSWIGGGVRTAAFARHLGCGLLGLILSTAVWYGAGF